MTPDELDATIAEIIIPQIKPRSTQNSYRRKQWENQRIWRLCTVGKSCKLGEYKQIFHDGKRHEELNFCLCSYYKGISGIFRYSWRKNFVEYSYHKKFLRRIANKHVRRYSKEIGDNSFYRKIFDYEWECW